MTTPPAPYTDYLTATHVETTTQFQVVWQEPSPETVPDNPGYAQLTFAWAATSVGIQYGMPELMLQMDSFLDHVQEWFEGQLGVPLVRQGTAIPVVAEARVQYTPPMI